MSSTARVALVATVALALTACAAKITVIDRQDGQVYHGSTDGSTMGGNGNATIVIEGKSYQGPWVYQPKSGAFGFSNFAGTSTMTGTANAFTPRAGFSGANIYGSGFSSGQAIAATQSAVGDGMLNARSDDGQFIRCVFTFNTMNSTGLGQCLRNDGREYDVQLKR